MPTIVGDLIPVTVLVPTVNSVDDHALPLLFCGLNLGPGPHISSINNSLFSN
jgi:hypothetical protein